MKLLIQSLLIISCASITSGFVPSSNQQHNLPENVLFAKGKKGFKRNKKDSLKASVTDETETKINLAPKIPPIPANSKRLFLIRHGEVIPPGGNHGVLYGALDVPLSTLGKKEAIAAAEFLKDIKFDQVCSSPLSRALYGANEIMMTQEKYFKRDTMFKRIIVDNDFTELSRGEWAGKTREEIGEDSMKRFNACDQSVTPRGGESYPMVMKRVLAARDELLKLTEAGQASCLVSHLQVTRCILSDAFDLPMDKITAINIATASISCVDYNIETGTQTVIFSSYKPMNEAEEHGDDV